jgi:hypothetical protein
MLAQLFFQPAFEHREDPMNPGRIESHCVLCGRLVAASRDESVLRVAENGHKCRAALPERKVSVKELKHMSSP